MKKPELLTAAADASAKTPAGTIRLMLPACWLPWNDFTAGRRHIGVMAVLQVTVPTSRSKYHVVVGAKYDNGVLDWACWCGDAFLEGRNKVTTAIEFPAGFTLDQAIVLDGLDSHEGVVSSPSAPCDFWTSHSCGHTDAALAWLHTNPHVLEAIEALWATAMPLAATGAAPAVAMGFSEVASYIFTHMQRPCLIMGDRGAGKTHFCRELADIHDASIIEVGLHEDVKASTLLGKLLPAPDGGFAWVDGPLSRSFRLAKRGKRVILLLDELLRTPQEQLSILLTALSAYKGKYRLCTSRVVGYDEDGVGIEEVLECDVANLAVVSTTNVGAHYVVGDIDPALKERFVVFMMNTTEDKLRLVLSATCEARALPMGLVEKLISFWKGATAMMVNGQLQHAPTLRVLTRSLERISKASELKASIMAEQLQWVALDSDGLVIEEQAKALESVAKASKI